MIASQRGVIAAWAIALVLGLALLIGPRADHAPGTRVLLPGFDAGRVAVLEWTGTRTMRIERDAQASTGWRWIEPQGEADRRAVDDLLAALRGGQWHRRADPGAAGKVTTTLTVTADAGKVAIGIGDPLGEEQRWITLDSPEPVALLVDTWVTRAIAPEPLSLRVQRPFATIGSANQIEVGSFVLSGSPRKVIKLAGLPIELLANATLVDTLEQSLRDLAVVAIPNGKVPVDNNYRGTRIALDGKLIAVEAGMCPAPNRDLHAIFGPGIGSACVVEKNWEAMLVAAAVFDVQRDPVARQLSLATLVERRPVPVEPIGIALPDGSQLELAKRPRVVDPHAKQTRDADPASIAELLAVLATPAERVPTPATPATGSLTITAERGVTFKLELYAGGVIARANEPIALRVGEGSAAILARAGAAYADTTIWSEEPTTIQSIQIGGVKLTRGAVLGEWTGSAGAIDAKRVDRLAGLLAALRSLGDAPPLVDPMPVILTIAPPSGSSFERKLLLGGGNPGPCAATTPDGSTVRIDPGICEIARQIR